MSAIEVRGLDHAYGSARVLSGVDFRAEPGQLTAIIGPNGAGKSTLLRAIVGLHGSRGRVRLQGQAIEAMQPRERARTVAYVPQVTELFAELRVAQVVEQGRYCWQTRWFGSPSEDAKHVDRALDTVGIGHLSQRCFLELSGGERRLVTLARALCSEAKILVLDEPTSSLDIAHRLSVCKLLRGLAGSGLAVVCVLHELEDVLKYADHCTLLHQGQVVGDGTPARVLTPAHVRRVYGVELVPGGGHGYRSLETVS